jgi:hypothetical protein
MMRDDRLRHPSAVLAALWLAAVVVIAALRGATGQPAPSGFASSAEAVIDGALWLLPASALVAQGALPAVQIALTAVLVYGVIRHLDGRVFWAVAITAHIGTTLVTDAGIGMLSLFDPADGTRIATVHDYGISAIAAGCVGALAVAGALGAVPRPRLAVGLGVAALLACVVLIPADAELADVEHLVALLAGATVALLALHHDGRAHRDALRTPRLPSLRRRPGGASSPLG